MKKWIIVFFLLVAVLMIVFPWFVIGICLLISIVSMVVHKIEGDLYEFARGR